MKINNLRVFLNNPILYVFTKEYREKVEYHSIVKKNINVFKLKNDNYDVDDSIRILKKKNFKNNLAISKIES